MGHKGHFISHGGQVIRSLFDLSKIPNGRKTLQIEWKIERDNQLISLFHL